MAGRSFKTFALKIKSGLSLKPTSMLLSFMPGGKQSFTESIKRTTFGLPRSTIDLIYLPALSEGKRTYRKKAVISTPYIVYVIHFFVFMVVTAYSSQFNEQQATSQSSHLLTFSSSNPYMSQVASKRSGIPNFPCSVLRKSS